jgi:hypothetical protein
MKKYSVMLIMCFWSVYIINAQQDLPASKINHTVVFYNVDKLYDIINDPSANDEEFLPSATKQWNDEKYRKKITDISKVLSSINENDLPSMIGLAEVENQKVLEDLVASSKLRKAKYGIVHYESKDPDCLDVALLYRKDEVEIIDTKPIPIVFGFDIKDVTKDILYVKCKIKDDNIFHLFVNHWPARIPNEQESEIKRITSAITLRKEVDNILNFDNKARIIIMGDFNDEPTNKSMMQMLNATDKRKNSTYRDLYNLMYDSHNTSDEGSFFESTKWFMFDQIIVSTPLFNNRLGSFLSFGDGKIYRGVEPQKTDNQQKIITPEPTYSGDKYVGGASSHFPVYVILKNKVY